MKTQTKHKIHVKDQYCAGLNCDCGYRAKHTPAPWSHSLGGSKPYHSQVFFQGAYKEEYMGEVLTKNARLIASAPELLGVLQELITQLHYDHADNCDGQDDCLYCKAKNIVKKAEGTL